MNKDAYQRALYQCQKKCNHTVGMAETIENGADARGNYLKCMQCGEKMYIDDTTISETTAHVAVDTLCDGDTDAAEVLNGFVKKFYDARRNEDAYFDMYERLIARTKSNVNYEDALRYIKAIFFAYKHNARSSEIINNPDLIDAYKAFDKVTRKENEE